MITLKNLHQATAQEVFDQVARHLLSQMKKSVNSEGECLYRFDGLKCGAGCLIADDEYRKEIERQSWPLLVGDGWASSFHEDLIERLQIIHDDNEPEDWPRELRRLAKLERLSDGCVA